MQNNDQRPDIKERVGIVLLILFVVFIMAWSDFGNKSKVKVYNCDLSEISPDFPVEVKEECMKMRLEEWRKQNDRRYTPTTST